jgi:plastocyanin
MSPDEANQTTAPVPTSEPPVKKKKNNALLILIGVVVLAVVAIGFYALNPGGIFTSKRAPATVTITGNGFSPATIKIKKGQAVEWVNEDSSTHQIASDPYPDHSKLPHLFADEPLAEGGVFNYTFEDTGTFTYHDHLRPADFHGTVVVE